MDREVKTFSFEVKEIDEEEGIFTGYAATFSKTPDSYGDIIDPGAFKKTLREGAKRIKILWNHHVLEPIGKPLEMVEDDKGLLVKGKLSLGVQRAKEVLSLMKDGVITEMSIGYNTMKETFTNGVRHLQEIRLWDVSPVTFAANPEAVITGVKAEELKPYPNEHACRLESPDKYDQFRRVKREHEGKEYSVIRGKLKDEAKWEDQAFRYDKEVWAEDEAKTHCKDHDGKFEPASEKQDKAGRVLSSSNLEKVKKGLEALQSGIETLQALLDAAEAEDEPAKATQLSEEAAQEAAELEQIVTTLKAENEGVDTKEAEERIEAILDKMKK